MLQCPRCLKKFPIASRLSRHVNGKKLCKLHPDGQDLNKIELMDLVKQNTPQPKIHKCHKCGKICSSEIQLDNHVLKCNGIGCFDKIQLRFPDEYRKYRKPKHILKAIFYCTYIDNPNSNANLIKKITDKYYKLYIDSKWTGRVTKYKIINKFLLRIIQTKSRYLNYTLKQWCKYWLNLNVITDKQLEKMIKNKKNEFMVKAGGRAFYKFLLEDIILAIDGGKEAVHQFNIFGMVPYKKYTEHLDNDLKLYDDENDNNIKEEKKLDLKNENNKLTKEINKRLKLMEKLYFKKKEKLDVYRSLNNIINGTDMKDNDDIEDMELSVLMIMEKYIISQKIQNDIYYYLEANHAGISFYHVYKKLDP